MSRRRWPGRRNALLLLALAAPACARTAGSVTREPATESTGPTTALAVDSALVAIASRPLWPGFAPLSTPVAIFDGTRTWLFRHPSPPAGYVAVEGRPDVVTRVGRDSVVTANTSARLGGVSTATVMLDPGQPAPAAAALTIHELFHVFQRARHPDWQANEADLFTYPVEDSVALALRREETVTLHRALVASAPDSIRCWASAFIRARVRRHAKLGDAGSEYERGTELNEGLAQFVERRAAGRAVTVAESDAPAAEVRRRAYDIGAGMAELLTRLQPGWERSFDASAPGTRMRFEKPFFEGLFVQLSSGSCPAPTPAQRTAWTEQAGADVRALVGERRRTLADYLSRAGWRVVVDASNGHFFPQGFDPLNVTRLSSTEILHTRFLKLQGALGAIELLSRASLTEGQPGAHPLFNGVVRLTVTGLPNALVVRDSVGVLVLEAPGLYGRLRSARADTNGTVIHIGPR